MSYTIFYRCVGIKVGEETMLVTESGCNNTFVTATGKRARDWDAKKYLSTEYPFTTYEKIKARYTQDRESAIKRNVEMLVKYPDWGAYSDAQFGYYVSLAIDPLHTSGTSFDHVLGFFQTAIDEAKPVEEIPFTLSIEANYQLEEECIKNKVPIPVAVIVTTTDELIEQLAQWKAEYGNEFRINLYG